MTYYLELPKHLIKMVESNEITINSNVIRNLSGKIIGHLEMANSTGITNILQVATPLRFFFSTVTSIDTIIQKEQIKNQNNIIITRVNNLNENVIKVSEKINNIINMINSTQILSWANLAITGVNIGVSIVEFTIINSKINSFNERINRIENLLLEPMKNEKREVLKDSKVLLDKTIKHISDLSSKPINDILDNNISNTIIELKNLIESSTNRYRENDLIQISLDIIIACYYSYTSLIKVYYTSLYLLEDSRYIDNKFTLDADKLKNDLITSDMSDILYTTIINDLENIFTEEDLKIFDILYKGVFKDNYDNISITEDILKDTSLEEYNKWNEKVKNSETQNQIILIEHNT